MATLGGPASARAVAPDTDATRLHRLLSVELLMVYCYEHVLGSPMLPPRDKQALTPLCEQEQAHVRALRAQLAALGGTPPAPPASAAAADRDLERRKVRARLGQLQGRRDALGLLEATERVVVGAYFVALLKLQRPQLITLAAQIMANDAQHEALIGEVLYHGNVRRAVPDGLVQGAQ